MNRRKATIGMFALAGSALAARKAECGEVPRAFNTVKKAMQEDEMYAWSWHCNIAMASVDEGMNPAAANRAAGRVMQSAFGVDTMKLGKEKGWL